MRIPKVDGSTRVLLEGTDGDDLIFADGAADRVYGRAGNDTIYGNQWLSEQLWGGDGNDWLISGAGDISKGARGDDVLVSTVGGDILVGGAGNDLLLAGGAHTEAFGGVGHDTIRVFQGRGFGQGGDDAMIAEDKRAPGYVDDGLPTFGTGVDRKYLSILWGQNAIAFGQDEVAFADGEVDREPSRGNGQGVDTLWSRRKWLIHPFGFKFLSTTITGPGLSPTWADLALATNWERVLTRKQVPMAFLVSNG